jgi:hypothetical protein
MSRMAEVGRLLPELPGVVAKRCIPVHLTYARVIPATRLLRLYLHG